MKTYNSSLIGFVIFGLIVFSCKKDSITTYNVNGFAQKGPFIIGTVITITELDKNLNQTGKTFTSTIIDDKGKFEIPEFEFASNFVQLSADGSYFRELYGYVEPDRLVLRCIADLDETRTANINILTHLEVERLKYLIKEEKLSFSQAKEQAYKEILNIFEINAMGTNTSDKLDISKTGNENMQLLAISSIILATRSTASLTELLTKIQNDIKEDGILDSEALQSDIITSAVLLDCERISMNLKNHYSNLGFEITLPNLRPVIDSFVSNSQYDKLVDIDIPQITELGKNILRLGDTILIDTNQNYCIAVNQVCHLNDFLTWLRFEDIEGTPCRENIQITNILNWGIIDPSFLDIFHPFGSHEHIDFLMNSFNGNSNLKAAFKNHGKVNIILDFLSTEYGYISKTQYIQW